MSSIDELDKLKTQVLKYVLYKKRSEAEVRQKFAESSEDLLDEVIDFLKENNYINDDEYIEKSVQEFQRLKNMSIKEIQYKLLSKGLKKDEIDNYIYENKEQLLEYELQSAKNIWQKKQSLLEIDEIENYLRKKGYLGETIKLVKQ